MCRILETRGLERIPETVLLGSGVLVVLSRVDIREPCSIYSFVVVRDACCVILIGTEELSSFV